MATPTLVEAEIHLGKDVFDALKEDPILKPSVAMWLYDEDAQEWRFLIATEDFNQRGPQAAYHRVQNVLRKSGLIDRLPLRKVVVTSPLSPLMRALRRSFKVIDGASLSLSECTFNGMRIPAAHIYYMQSKKSPSSETSDSQIKKKRRRRKPAKHTVTRR